MPLIDTGPHSLPYLLYNAPVDEKTMALREKFKVDPKTGYPECYNWRLLSRLGYDYSPEDPFYKFGAYDPNRSMTTRIGGSAFFVAGIMTIHAVRVYYKGHHWLTRAWQVPLASIPTVYFFLWLHDKTLTRAGRKEAVIVDYVSKHPERFGPIQRAKYRELLWTYTPIR